ncbi:MAG: twin-arginine translocase TatA/TatE family subunit [Chitinophagales bacterium]|nr:twin-arginine translocase TatA/TatE family subunit [Chitinophagales bacterium]
MNIEMDMMFLLSMPGGGEMFVIILVVLLFFGGKKIPELMRGLGKGIREFNNAKDSVKEELEAGMRGEPTKKTTRKEIEDEN